MKKKKKADLDAENGFAPFVYFASDGYLFSGGDWRVTVMMMIVAGNGSRNECFSKKNKSLVKNFVNSSKISERVNKYYF